MKNEATNIVIDILLFLARNRFEKRAFYRRTFIGEGLHVQRGIELICDDVRAFFVREQFPIDIATKTDGASTLLTVSVERKKRD